MAVTRAQRRRRSPFDDIVEGKGRGIIVLLQFDTLIVVV